MEDALIEVPTMRRFAGINLISERIPDETTILAFRHLLEGHHLGKQIYCFAEDCVNETVKAHLKAIGMAMKQGTIIEHHIFPGLNSSYYPQLRRLLQEHYGDRYQLLPGSEAWRLLLATPRHYRSADVVCAADGSRAMRLPRLRGQTV